MPTYIALLRGINVSGHNLIKMAALQASCVALGYERVQTYLQSGNIVFDAKKSSDAKLAAEIAKRLVRDHELDVPVLVKSAAEWTRIAQENPFLTEPGLDATKLHVTLLAAPPQKARLEKLAAIQAGPDRYVVAGDRVYLHCPAGYGNSKLANPAVERALGVTATTRNWNTVTALQKLAAE
jgi:uncharacterized protein (DUF1697 family)